MQPHPSWISIFLGKGNYKSERGEDNLFQNCTVQCWDAAALQNKNGKPTAAEITHDNQTFLAIFNKIQQMSTLQMTLKTTDTEKNTKQQISPACSAERAGF